MKTTFLLASTGLGLVLALGSLAYAQSRTFTIRDQGGSRIQFVSDAPLETITGVSSRVSGTVQVDPNNLGATRGTIQVPVSSLRTGIDLRDEHLHSANWLDAPSFPNATLEITGVEGATRLQPNQDARIRIQGRFTLHGVTNDVVANARVRYIPVTEEMRSNNVTSDVIRAQASFRVQLDDYGVSIPSVVQFKVANEIRVNVSVRALAGSGQS
ncbi:MAG: YceI family protein [Sandaracinaceae bacterium]